MNITISLTWSSLKYEIDYETYKAAEITITDNPIVKGEAQSDNTNGDADFCRTKINIAMAHLEDVMHRYFVKSSLTNADDSLDRTQQTWDLTITIPDNERRGFNTDTITSLSHRYVVNYLLAEWCKLALPNMATQYKQLTDEAMADIQNALGRKNKPSLDISY